MNNAYIRAQQCKVKEAKFPFVKIGSQYWTTKNLSLAVTPQGTLIPKMQANGNVEKVVNGGFDSDTAWGKGAGWTISGGTLNALNTSPAADPAQAALIIGNWYKCTYTISALVSGTVRIRCGWGANGITRSVTGTFTEYLQCQTNTAVGFTGFSFTGSIDNVSVQEIGWPGSQELYDGIYAQTAGTVEQKTYAAVKAAAMWCNYNKDAPTGLIYGKLYNWFAVKLFQMDIDYYNAANPDKKWASGFRMPTQAEFQTLSDYLGGNAVSGGHLKEAGLAHWNSPNTGADNLSGFSALGSGQRLEDGSFSGYNSLSIFYLTDGRLFVQFNATNTIITTIDNRIKGFSLRLIKA